MSISPEIIIQFQQRTDALIRTYDTTKYYMFSALSEKSEIVIKDLRVLLISVLEVKSKSEIPKSEFDGGPRVAFDGYLDQVENKSQLITNDLFESTVEGTYFE